MNVSHTTVRTARSNGIPLAQEGAGAAVVRLKVVWSSEEFLELKIIKPENGRSQTTQER